MCVWGGGVGCGIPHLQLCGISSRREKEILSVKSEQSPGQPWRERGGQAESHREAAHALAGYRGKRHPPGPVVLYTALEPGASQARLGHHHFNSQSCGKTGVSKAVCDLGDQTRKERKAFWPEAPVNPGVTNSPQVSCHPSILGAPLVGSSPQHPLSLIPRWAWSGWLSAYSG